MRFPRDIRTRSTHTHRRPLGALGLVLAVAAAAGAGCGAGSGAAADGRVAVVAAENVYGDMAARIGGPAVDVTSILSDPRADPHLYEPGAANAADVAHADVVVRNGLGYDAFIDDLLASTPNPTRIVVDISSTIGVTGTGANPHLWYDLPRVPDMAAAIAAALERAAPDRAQTFRSGLASFERSLAPLEDAVTALRAAHAGDPVAYTEPVPAYLIEAADLTDRSPQAFARAIEEGTDPTPQAVAAMQALITGREIAALLVNGQARAPVTDQVRSLAASVGVPVVVVTETLPTGLSFVAWQLGQVRALNAALGG